MQLRSDAAPSSTARCGPTAWARIHTTRSGEQGQPSDLLTLALNGELLAPFVDVSPTSVAAPSAWASGLAAAHCRTLRTWWTCVWGLSQRRAADVLGWRVVVPRSRLGPLGLGGDEHLRHQHRDREHEQRAKRQRGDPIEDADNGPVTDGGVIRHGAKTHGRGIAVLRNRANSLREVRTRVRDKGRLSPQCRSALPSRRRA